MKPDLPFVLGVTIALVLLIGALIYAGANVISYISIDSGLLVGGGVLGAALAGMTFKEYKLSFLAMRDTLFKKQAIDWNGTVELFTQFAAESRREGVLSLQRKIEEQESELIRTGLQLIVDGVDSEILEQVISTKIQMQKTIDKLGEKTCAKATSLAPSFGLLGTVTGLVQVLGNLSSPEKLGSGIAQAFMTTLYGLILANLVFGPLTAKFERNNAEKARFYEMVLTGLQAIHEGDNPFIIEEKLNAFCPELLQDTPEKKVEASSEVGLNEQEGTQEAAI